MILLPQIRQLDELKLVGIKATMCFAQHHPEHLWKFLMPRLATIRNARKGTLYSIEVYPSGFWNSFEIENTFEKWAAISVNNFDDLPEGMHSLTIPAGKYAVFHYRGSSTEASIFYERIFKSWLPLSDYILDDRPHFASMGEGYKRNKPESEEEIWIPVLKK
ncbi:MAG: GyrI-like domain-containing protein [Bacteroidetes bacterium]|nr:GyrI-like domain-containing protein [Bacteroidota bacterium]MBS1741131.1 GyrI-like domain-containing protein [Bacteroidota bacterium]